MSLAPDAEPPHILVVDDDTRIRELLGKYLTRKGFMVSTARDAAEARARLQAMEFDLIVLDVMMPGETGLALTADLRRGGRSLPILMLTARTEVGDRVAGLESGADDYLAKPFEPRELELRIHSILRRMPKPAAPARTLRFGRWTWATDGDEMAGEGGETLRLTEGEARLLRLLAGALGEPVSRDDLAERLKLEGNPRAVDVAVVRLRRKLEDDPGQPRFLRTVRGEGYVLRSD
ncbi:MAG TPA: response regulator [Alphaproteobacteria bacterium]|nr:response regulator [Alphaproteobacteria bacterium]